MSGITRRVWKTPATINNLTHGFTWITDADLNAKLLQRYRNYDYLTDSAAVNVVWFQDVIASWHQYIDDLYNTTLLQYDPLYNYKMAEVGGWTDAKHKGTKRSTATDLSTVDTPRVERTTLETGFGFDSDADGVSTGKTTELEPTGTDTRNVTGEAANNYETYQDIDATHYDKDVRTFDSYEKHGYIGVKPQELVEAQRKIIIDVVDIYLMKFRKCFNLSSHIADEPFEEVSP